MYFAPEDVLDNEEPERYDLSLTEYAFDVLYSYLELDRKGRKAVMDLIENESKRCNNERQKDPNYNYGEILEQIEYEIGCELDH